MITRQKCLLTISIIALMLVIGASIWAETIRLKNGRIFEGEFVEERDDEFKILMNSGVVSFSRDEIASIGERKITQKELKKAVNSMSTPAPENKPAVKKTKKSATVTTKPIIKSKRKAITKAKVKSTDTKTTPPPKDVPAAPMITTTFTSFASSTTPVSSASSAPIIASVTTLPLKLQNESTLTAKVASVIIVLAVIAIIVLIRRRKRRPKDI